MQRAVACLCMQPFPCRNAERRRDEASEEKSAHARREGGPQDLRGGKERVGQRKTDVQELVISGPPLKGLIQEYNV